MMTALRTAPLKKYPLYHRFLLNHRYKADQQVPDPSPPPPAHPANNPHSIAHLAVLWIFNLNFIAEHVWFGYLQELNQIANLWTRAYSW